MLTCNIVAKETQSKYGIAIIAQIRVINNKIISIEANRLFLSPNCSGEKAALNTRLSIKGKDTIQGILPMAA
jgi:hypothetical protein